jgi:hypothetical protein
VGAGKSFSIQSICAATGNISGLRQINTSSGNLLSVEGNMIDAVLSISVFAALVLCIVGFDAWAPRRAQSRRADISLDL